MKVPYFTGLLCYKHIRSFKAALDKRTLSHNTPKRRRFSILYEPFACRALLLSVDSLRCHGTR